jgi:hypothetical protein
MKLTKGPADRIRDAVSDVADAAWDVAGAVVGVAIVSEGIRRIGRDSASSDDDSDGDSD